MTTIGVIADTHGLLRAEVRQWLHGCDLILHAGDIGKEEVLTGLERIAPVIAVRGNIDTDNWAQRLKEREVIEVAGKRICLLHNIKDLNLEAEGVFDAIVFGHSHKPLLETKEGVFYFNAGSAGPRRFKLPIAVGKLMLSATGISAEVKEITIKK